MTTDPRYSPNENPVTGQIPDDDIDEMYAEVKDLFKGLIGEARYILKAGTTQNKIALMRSVIPVLMKEMQAREAAAGNEETKNQLKDLFASAREGLNPSEPAKLDDLPEAPP